MIATKLFDDLDLGETRSWRDKLHRWLDPQVGRWISEDPIGFAAGDANVYRYVGNGSTTHIDPTGLNGGTVSVDDLVEAAIGDLIPPPPPPPEPEPYYDDGPIQSVPLYEDPMLLLLLLFKPWKWFGPASRCLPTEQPPPPPDTHIPSLEAPLDPTDPFYGSHEGYFHDYFPGLGHIGDIPGDGIPLDPPPLGYPFDPLPN